MRILVTGSTQGIGQAIAAAFAKRGDEVIVHGSKNKETAEHVCREIGASAWVTCDFSNAEEVRALHEKTGPVDCLILNASVQYKEAWSEVKWETLDAQLNVNIKSTFSLMQQYIPAMQARGFGRVVTVGSVNQYRNHPMLTVYSATKCAVMSMVKNIAKQVAPFGVTVNNIAPGAIYTPRNADTYDDMDKRRAVEATIPMGRFGEPSDCVGAVLLLCSEAGGYITGADIVIDGGIRL